MTMKPLVWGEEEEEEKEDEEGGAREEERRPEEEEVRVVARRVGWKCVEEGVWWIMPKSPRSRSIWVWVGVRFALE